MQIGLRKIQIKKLRKKLNLIHYDTPSLSSASLPDVSHASAPSSWTASSPHIETLDADQLGELIFNDAELLYPDDVRLPLLLLCHAHSYSSLFFFLPLCTRPQ